MTSSPDTLGAVMGRGLRGRGSLPGRGTRLASPLQWLPAALFLLGKRQAREAPSHERWNYVLMTVRASYQLEVSYLVRYTSVPKMYECKQQH
jgi:hypothetical protein